MGMLTSLSLYRSNENVAAGEAQGNDKMPGMGTVEYATAIVNKNLKRILGRA
jgi:hypothetical protein